MDLDDVKKMAREVKAPQIAGRVAADASGGTDGLLQAVMAADETECRQTRKAFPFYLIAAALYAVGCVSFFLGSSSGSPSRAIHFGVLAAIFLLLSILMLRKLHSIRALDYSMPVRGFLAETECRYRFLRFSDLWYVIPLVLVIAVTGGLAVVDALIPRYFLESQRALVLAVYGLFFAAICCMGYYFSYQNWKRDKGGILEDIRRMRRELGSE
jgi:hypothetical protein